MTAEKRQVWEEVQRAVEGLLDVLPDVEDGDVERDEARDYWLGLFRRWGDACYGLRKNLKRKFVCAECGQDMCQRGAVTMYMVHDDLWLSAMPDKKGFLHLHCLEQRLGREIEFADFTSAQINEEIRYGYRLRRAK